MTPALGYAGLHFEHISIGVCIMPSP
jgi:hypothetical protein